MFSELSDHERLWWTCLLTCAGSNDLLFLNMNAQPTRCPVQWSGSIQNNSGGAPPAAKHENCLLASVCVCVLMLCSCMRACNSQHAQALHPILLHSGSTLLHLATNMTVTSPSVLSPPGQQLQHLLLIVCSGCLLTSLRFFSSAHPAIKV